MVKRNGDELTRAISASLVTFVTAQKICELCKTFFCVFVTLVDHVFDLRHCCEKERALLSRVVLVLHFVLRAKTSMTLPVPLGATFD